MKTQWRAICSSVFALMLFLFVFFSFCFLLFFIFLGVGLPLYLQKRQELGSTHMFPFCTDKPAQDVPQASFWSPVRRIPNERMVF